MSDWSSTCVGGGIPPKIALPSSSLRSYAQIFSNQFPRLVKKCYLNIPFEQFPGFPTKKKWNSTGWFRPPPALPPYRGRDVCVTVCGAEVQDRMWAKCRALGIPLYRFYSHRAKEFISRPVRMGGLPRRLWWLLGRGGRLLGCCQEGANQTMQGMTGWIRSDKPYVR